MMRALKFLVLCTFTCAWTIDIFVDGPVVLLDCRGHDGTKMLESTTTSYISEATEKPKGLFKTPSEGHIISVGNKEFLVVIKKELSWSDARAWCEDYWGGDLASPSNPRDLADHVRALSKREYFPFGMFWLGGQRSEGGWTWVSGEAITAGWYPGAPRGAGDCIFLYPSDPSFPNGTLTDFRCSSKDHFICEQ